MSSESGNCLRAGPSSAEPRRAAPCGVGIGKCCNDGPIWIRKNAVAGYFGGFFNLSDLLVGDPDFVAGDKVGGIGAIIKLQISISSSSSPVTVL